VARAVAILELLVLLAAMPLLLFPSYWSHWTAFALVGLLLVWLLRWAVQRELWPLTPFNGALVLFVVTIPVAVWASALPELTIPKLAGLILGLAAFRAIALAVHNRNTLGWGLVVFSLLGLGMTAAGVLGAGWPAKVRLLQPLVARLPRLLAGFPGAPAEGINPNQLAGLLMLYLPFSAAGVLGWWQERHPWPALVSLAGLGLAAGTLTLTQSRGGWVGGACGMLALAVLWALSSQRRWLRILAVVTPALIVAVTISTVLYVGPGRVGEILYGAEPSVKLEQAVGQISITGRVEIWSRAIYAIQDFPFTGTGLGTFRRVVNLLYPLFLVGPDVDIAHAHNMFLQVAVDLGLPGLVAYLALLWLAGVVTWQVARRGSPVVRATALGLLAGLIGLHVYGLTDALAPGSKPGLAFWVALGLIAALPRVVKARESWPADDPSLSPGQ